MHESARSSARQPGQHMPQHASAPGAQNSLRPPQQKVRCQKLRPMSDSASASAPAAATWGRDAQGPQPCPSVATGCHARFAAVKIQLIIRGLHRGGCIAGEAKHTSLYGHQLYGMQLPGSSSSRAYSCIWPKHPLLASIGACLRPAKAQGSSQASAHTASR
jgi:hypothetical protein